MAVTAYEQVAPAAFVSMERSVNTPFAFGGEDLTHLYYRVVFFAQDLYQLDGVMSLCTDAYNAGIKNLGYDQRRLTRVWRLKNRVLQLQRSGPELRSPGGYYVYR